MPNFELLRQAYKVIAAVPRDEFSLDQINTIEGDVLIGDPSYWLAQNPIFQHFGLSLQRGGGIYINDEYTGYRIGMAKLFSIRADEAYELFRQRESGHDDHVSDKAIFLTRVATYLRSHQQPVPRVGKEMNQ